MQAVKIKEYRIGKRGDRGLTVTLPQVWARDHDLGPGDVLEIYRESGVEDRLIVTTRKASTVLAGVSDGYAAEDDAD